MKRIACQGILKQIFFSAKNYIGGDGRHFCCQSGCPEQVYIQRIYPGCSYGGNAHRSGSDGDDYGCCVGDESFRDGTINNGKRFPFIYDRRHNFCVSLNQKLGKRVDLSAIWTIASGNWMTVSTRSTVTLSPDGKGMSMVDYSSSRNNYRLPLSHRLDFSINIHKKKRHGERIWNFGMCNANAIRFKAPFNAVDAASFMAKNKGGELVDFYMTKVHLQDVAGERNFYRMVMSYESEYRASEVPSGSPYKEGQFLCRASRDIVFDNKYESLLYRNLKIGMEDNSSDADNYYANEYNLFMDNTFADKEHTLKLAVEKTLLHNYYPNSWSRDEYVPAEYGKICFRVLSMSRSTYTYMNDYAFDNSEQGSWTFIDEIPYPSNVSGGTGMVSIMTPADFYIDLSGRGGVRKE